MSRRAWFCPTCGGELARYSYPAGDETCMEATCPSCKLGFDIHLDGCVVRDGRLADKALIARIEKLVAIFTEFPNGAGTGDTKCSQIRLMIKSYREAE